MASFPWNTKSSRTSGIASEAITTGAGFLGSAIDNATNLDTHLSLDVSFAFGTNPVVDTVLYIYLLYSDGTNYEDGGTALQPKKVPTASLAVSADTDTHRRTINDIPIPPKPFKILVWNATAQTATVTVLANSYKMGYAA